MPWDEGAVLSWNPKKWNLGGAVRQAKVYGQATLEVVEQHSIESTATVFAAGMMIANDYQFLRKNTGDNMVSSAAVATGATFARLSGLSQAVDVHDQQVAEGKSNISAWTTGTLYVTAKVTGVAGLEAAAEGSDALTGQTFDNTERASLALTSSGQLFLTATGTYDLGRAGLMRNPFGVFGQQAAANPKPILSTIKASETSSTNVTLDVRITGKFPGSNSSPITVKPKLNLQDAWDVVGNPIHDAYTNPLGATRPLLPANPESLWQAAAQRNSLGQTMRRGGGGTGAVYIGGESGGKVATGASSVFLDMHAEDVVAAQLGPNANFTNPFGWRTNPATGLLECQPIPVCVRCQAKFSRAQFPPDVLFDPGGAWSAPPLPPPPPPRLLGGQ